MCMENGWEQYWLAMWLGAFLARHCDWEQNLARHYLIHVPSSTSRTQAH